MWEKWLKKKKLWIIWKLASFHKKCIVENGRRLIFPFGFLEIVYCVVCTGLYYGVGVLYTGRCMELLYYVLDDVWRCFTIYASWCTMYYWTMYGAVVLCTGRSMEMFYYVLGYIRSWCTMYWTIYREDELYTELVYYILDNIWRRWTIYWTIYGDGVLYTERYMEMVYYIEDDIWRWCAIYRMIFWDGVLYSERYMEMVYFVLIDIWRCFTMYRTMYGCSRTMYGCRGRCMDAVQVFVCIQLSSKRLNRSSPIFLWDHAWPQGRFYNVDIQREHVHNWNRRWARKSPVNVNCVLCTKWYREMNCQFNMMMYGIIFIGITKSLMM